MKSPQEQAKEMIFDLQLNSWSKTHILESIPLPELIAVAQAANRVVTEKSIRNQMQAEFEMLNALDALRATGKVEL